MEHLELSKREKDRQRKARWRAKGNRDAPRGGRLARNRPFVGVDGEGYTDARGRHVYNMLRAGDSLLSNQDYGKLSTYDILDFLVSLDPGNIYVAYFFDYDVTKILEDVPWTKLRRLMDREARMPRSGPANNPYPVDLFDDEFQIDYLPGKMFKVHRLLGTTVGEDGKPKKVYSKWITINDVGSFFQCRFPIALERWQIGTPDQRDAIEHGKSLRNDFARSDWDEIERYNRLEIILLQDLMEQFRNACAEVGYVPRNWQGPGQIAEVMLHINNVPRSRDVPLLADPKYAGLLEYARNAFYGGRPETGGVGPIPGPIIQYDLNSAYPYALQFVPCLLHGTWKRTKAMRGSILDMSICYGDFGPKVKGRHKRAHMYGLPFRTETGTIMYPESGRGWYWGFEINASIHQEFKVRQAWIYERACDCQPFAFIPGVYAQRKALGKDGRGIVLKLALNSLYGKMAQSIGYPKYANPIWASFITAFCRTEIQKAMHQSPQCQHGSCGSDIAMIATDAIFSSSELPITIGEELGEFSQEIHPDGIFIVQPGLYFGSSTDSHGARKRAKTRGVPLGLVTDREQEFRENYERMRISFSISDGDVRLPVRSFVGIRQALHRNSPRILGQWIANDKVVSFDWTRKRNKFLTLPNYPFSTHLTTLPYLEPPHPETVPYNKDIGALLELQHIDSYDQPDWSDEAYLQSTEDK